MSPQLDKDASKGRSLRLLVVRSPIASKLEAMGLGAAGFEAQTHENALVDYGMGLIWDFPKRTCNPTSNFEPRTHSTQHSAVHGDPRIVDTRRL